MSYDQGFYLGDNPNPPSDYGFQQFDYTAQYNQAGNANNPQPNLFTPSMNTDPFSSSPGHSDDPYADEPPLLEELGINFDQITQKTLAVINPLKSTQANILHDADLAGPLVFCLAFGVFLLLTGKVSFGFIYGIGIIGCLSMYFLLNLMSPPEMPITFACTVSVLGYCLLPMVLLSGLSVVFKLNNGFVGTIAALLTVIWCSWSASKLFVTALTSHNQQPLIMYPCALLYGVFALLTVF
ncbi:Protein YIPF7 [Halotydeus destructor]|nr:Protein YIPF7 [Halotydeus destructor]